MTTQETLRTSEKVTESLGLLSRLLRDATPDQRSAATWALYAYDLGRWVDDAPESVAVRRARNLADAGYMSAWLSEQVDRKTMVGGWVMLRQRGPVGLRQAADGRGGEVSDATYARRLDDVLDILARACVALLAAGAEDKGTDATDRSFARAGGSVSYL